MRRAQLLTVIVLVWGARTVLGQDALPALAPAATGEYTGLAIQVGPRPSAAADGPTASRFWVDADYVVYWLKPVCLTVPTISAGSPGDAQPGVIGQPNTQILQGDHKFEFKGANGLRPRVGAWLDDDQIFGVEAEGFVLEQVAATSNVTPNSAGPPTFLVFQNPNNTPGALPFTIPGVVAGSSTAVGTTHLWGVETNLDIHISMARGPWTLNATALLGCRFLELDDRDVLTNQQSLVSNPGVAAVGEANFGTRNQFFGGQAGSRMGIA